MRRALTLIEVVLSMGLLAVAIVTLVMALPSALRVQERTRFQLYAAAKGMELVDRFLGETAVNSGPTDGGGSTYNTRRAFTFEANQPWDTPGGRRLLDPDLELRTAIVGSALLPLPRELAYRIDSPDDEIRRILDAGGQLYYGSPTSANPLRLDGARTPRPPSESLRLVVAVVGHAQQNALQHYPWKDWPYYAAYPSPPTFWKSAASWNYGNGDLRFETEEYTFWGDPDVPYLYDTNLAGTGFDWDGNTTSGTRQYATRSGIARDATAFTGKLPNTGWLQAKGQLVLALWYGWHKGLPPTVLYGRATAADIAACAQDPQKVRALRYLAWAGMCMTKWYPLAAEPLRPPRAFPTRVFWDWANMAGADMAPAAVFEGRPPHDGLTAGVLLPGDDDPAASPGLARTVPTAPYPTLADLLAPLPPGAAPNPFLPAALDPLPAGHPALGRSGALVDAGGGRPGHLGVTVAMIANWHEACLGAVMAYAAANPYDWSEPRPFERQLFTDHPLLQWDICSDDRLYGTIAGTPQAGVVGTVAASQWRPIAARPITNHGWNRVTTEGVCPKPANNPAAPLARPKGRYSTTAAGTPTLQEADYDAIRGDASRFNLCLPFAADERCRQLVFYMVDWTSWRDFETAASAPQDAARYPRWNWDYAVEKGANVVNPSAGFASRMDDIMYWDVDMPFMRNPEKVRLFVLDQSATPTGAHILYHTAGPDGQHDVNQTEREAYVYRHAQPGTESNWKRVDLGHATDSSVPVLDGVTLPADHPRRVFSGLYGADRNGNMRLDRGPLSPGLRLRAVEVARLNFYDPRLSLGLR